MSYNRDALLAGLHQLPDDWALIPVKNKRGYLGGWQKAGLSRKAIVTEVKKGEANGIGCLCGTLSGGLLFVDFDGPTAQSALPPELPYEALPKTVAMTSGRAGRHQRIYRVPEQYWEAIETCRRETRPQARDENGNKLEDSEQLELRWNGCQSVVAGYHPDTQGMYRWVEGCAPWEVGIAEAPLALIEMMLKEKPADRSQPRASLQLLDFDAEAIPLEKLLTRDHARDWESGVGEGRRDNTAIAIAKDLIGAASYCDLMGIRYSGDPWQLLEDFASRCSPPLGAKDVARIWKSAEKSNPKPCRGIDERVAYNQGRRREIALGAPVPRSAAGLSLVPSSGSNAPYDAPEGAPARRWPELIAALLDATVTRDDATAMDLRAEAIARFKRTDTQIDAAMFRLLTEREAGVQSAPAGPRRGVDLTKVQGLDYLQDGFVIARDQAVISAAHGTGKTTAMLELAFALLRGDGFLDQGKPNQPRVDDNAQVIYIASDSDASPLVAALQNLGMDGHPWVVPGPQHRLSVWAHDPDEGRTAWRADIAGCLELLEAVKARPTALVIIDSVKAVCADGTGISYTDNSSVTALLTFFKRVICQHSAVVWLNHDGKDRGSGAGAKAWREVPSICHHIERVEGEDSSDASHRRRWKCIKDRIGTERQFDYELDSDTGCLRVCEGVEVVSDCRSAIIAVLTEAYRSDSLSLSKGLLAQLVQKNYRFSSQSISNTLTRMAKARWPEIVRPPNTRGQYALSPRMVERLKQEDDASRSRAYKKGGFKREVRSINPLQGEGLSHLPSTYHRELTVSPDGGAPTGLESLDLLPREGKWEYEGNSQEALQGQGLSAVTYHSAPLFIGDPSRAAAGSAGSVDAIPAAGSSREAAGSVPATFPQPPEVAISDRLNEEQWDVARGILAAARPTDGEVLLAERMQQAGIPVEPTDISPMRHYLFPGGDVA